MQTRQTNNVFLKKDLILDVCEPYMQKVRVFFYGTSFNLFKFGTFEYEDETFAFGTEENEYNSIFANGSYDSKLPIVFARILETDDGDTAYELVPQGRFTDLELDSIEETIEYSLESQRTMAHYSTYCYG